MSKEKDFKKFDPVSFMYEHRAILILLVFVLIAVLSSLKIYQEEVLNIDNSVEYKKEDTLYFATERIDTLNPLVSNSEDIYYISKLVYEPLFDYDSNLGIIQCLSKDYRVDTEKAYIEVDIRDDVKFHNGKKLKAQDVCYTVNAIKSIGSKSPYYDKASKIVYCYAENSDTVVFYFKNNYNCSLDDLVFPILPSNQFKSYFDLAKAYDSFKMIGTGKYMYSSYNSLKRLRLKPFENYNGTVPENKIVFNIIPKRDMAKNMMDINEVNCYFDSDTNRKSSIANDNNIFFDIPSNYVDFIFFNENGIFNKKDLRKAVLYSIDSERVIDSAYMSDGVLSDTLFYPNYYGTSESENQYDFDYNKAKELLNSAGYHDLNGDNNYKDYYGRTLTVKLLVNKSNSLRTAAARIIKKNLEQAGFKVQLNALSKQDYDIAMANKDYDLLILGYSFNESYDLRELFNGKNKMGYINSDLFEKIRNLERLHTIEEYKSIYQEFKRDIIDYAQYYPVCYKYMSMITTENFEAEKLPVFNNLYYNCDTWYRKTVSVNQEESPDEGEQSSDNTDNQ